jgi:hypothetical protein
MSLELDLQPAIQAIKFLTRDAFDAPLHVVLDFLGYRNATRIWIKNPGFGGYHVGEHLQLIGWIRSEALEIAPSTAASEVLESEIAHETRRVLGEKEKRAIQEDLTVLRH